MRKFFSCEQSDGLDEMHLSDREALRRMIQYAWAEAEREGAAECAELLSAALLALDHAVPGTSSAAGTEPRRLVS